VEWHFLWRAVQPLFQPLDMWCSLKTGLTVSSSKGSWGPRICILYFLETWQLSCFCMSFCKSIQCDSGQFPVFKLPGWAIKTTPGKRAVDCKCAVWVCIDCSLS
jgi:hypothetical protein